MSGAPMTRRTLDGAKSGGRVLLSTRTLYGTLQRLLDHGWIERVKQDETPRDGRTYRLTSRGRLRSTGKIYWQVAPPLRRDANFADACFSYDIPCNSATLWRFLCSVSDCVQYSAC